MLLLLMALWFNPHPKTYSDGYRDGCIAAQNSSNTQDDEILSRCMEADHD